jgi:hypothetical protein
MIVPRHKILLKRLNGFLSETDFANIRMAAVCIIMFLIFGFFAYQIYQTVDQGLQAENRVQTIAKQVALLEKENKLLQARRDIAMSESEIEAQFRALGYQKPGEEVYIVNRQDFIEENTSNNEDGNLERDNINYILWLNLIFN